MCFCRGSPAVRAQSSKGAAMTSLTKETKTKCWRDSTIDPIYIPSPAKHMVFGSTEFWFLGHLDSRPGPNVSTTPITAMGCRQCLPLSAVHLKGKHCRKPHCRNGVVDTFGHRLFIGYLEQKCYKRDTQLLLFCENCGNIRLLQHEGSRTQFDQVEPKKTGRVWPHYP